MEASGTAPPIIYSINGKQYVSFLLQVVEQTILRIKDRLCTHLQ